MKKKMIYPLIMLFVIALDQITKYMVRSSMEPGSSIPVLGNLLRICYVQNTGTAFSMFAGNRFITIFLTSILIIGCIFYTVREIKEGHRAIPLLLSCVAAGGISNMIDRLTQGFVTDMISCGSFAVFNVADMFISCGCILLMILVLLLYREESASERTEKGDSNE